MLLTPPAVLAHAGTLDGHEPGATYLIQGVAVRRVGALQRRRCGERVDVVDGRGVRLRCRIAETRPGTLVLEVVERVREPAPGVRLVLVQALTIGDRDEMAVEGAVEAGVDDVVPWQARRSVVVWRGERVATNRTKWRAVVQEATQQARRAWLPSVAEPVDSAGLVSLVRDVTSSGGAALVLHSASPAPVTEIALPAPGDPAPRVLVVVGPEGGIAPAELAELTDVGARTVCLGPHVMSTANAGPVALAFLAERLGRWSRA